jgi:hypothetical protein
MKVLCISPIVSTDKGYEKAPRPEVGDIDAVIETIQVFNGSIYYSLERFGKDLGYRSDHFAPLSDIDETELVNEKETVNA